MFREFVVSYSRYIHCASRSFSPLRLLNFFHCTDRLFFFQKVCCLFVAWLLRQKLSPSCWGHEGAIPKCWGLGREAARRIGFVLRGSDATYWVIGFFVMQYFGKTNPRFQIKSCIDNTPRMCMWARGILLTGGKLGCERQVAPGS